MKRIVSLIIALSALTGCIKEKQTGADLKTGDILPDFEVVMNDGTVMTDDILHNEVSVVMFFSTLCKDCQQVLPQMQRIYDEYISKGIIFVLISRAQDKEEVSVYWKENNLTMPYSAQKDRTVYEKFARERIPRVYICEKGGIIRYVYTDNPNPSYDDLKSSLEAVIR